MSKEEGGEREREGGNSSEGIGGWRGLDSLCVGRAGADLLSVMPGDVTNHSGKKKESM